MESRHGRKEFSRESDENGYRNKGKGKKGGEYTVGKWVPPYYLYTGGYLSKYLGPEGKDAWGLVIDHMSEKDKRRSKKKRRQRLKRGKCENGQRSGPFGCSDLEEKISKKKRGQGVGGFG